ncbi:class I SAM-dependent methyltransferase [[Limnothrix rosea] IAM M-220]|uniref:class I SAM-dependent methyltransferase n=1 Tax=[Limnothrix rosea] IAM M-220 TaxID=454133 RepID=UPI00095F9CF5|nr:class I SAM-dependent methyltransferase [[Limnothrix rosea] IAM M-220]OKH18887.1 SAM-dependent methyltransferase [[Limnothrix rosea] IAM M-220]
MTQLWRAEEYADKAAFVSELGSPVLGLLDAQQGERILDLGCGDGTLGRKIQQKGAEVMAVDASASMVAAAQQQGLKAAVINGETLAFEAEFDAVFSNAALHWMPDYPSVIAGVYRALKPTGRFVGEFGGEGNIQCLLAAIAATFTEHPDWGEWQNPWYFPAPKQYAQALTAGGFHVEYIELIPRPTPLAAGIQAWLNIFAQQAIATLPLEQQQLFLNKVTEKVKPHLYTDETGWVADYMRLRFVATKVTKVFFR